MSEYSYPINDETTYYLNTDGASKGNSGEAGCGYTIYEKKKQFNDSKDTYYIKEIEMYHGHKYLGKETNNVAEYSGLLIGLERAIQLGITKLDVSVDSTLLVGQVTQNWNVNLPHLIPFVDKAKSLILKFKSFNMKQIPRAENKRADELSNVAIRLQLKHTAHVIVNPSITYNLNSSKKRHKLLKRKQISINNNIQQNVNFSSEDDSDTDNQFTAELDGKNISDLKLWYQLHDFLIGFQPRRQMNRQHIELNGSFMKIMLRDTERCDPVNLKQLIKTIDIVQIIIPNEKNRGKGLFKATVKNLIEEMQKLGHWNYIYIECINNERFFKYLISRNDIIYREWNGQSVWIDLNDRTERIVETQQDLMNRAMQLPGANYT